MKRLIVTLLSVILLFLLCACNNTSDANTLPKKDEILTKEELLQNATAYSGNQIAQDILDNIAKAKQSYCDKTVVVDGYVYEINEDHIHFNGCVIAYLPVEELVELQQGQYIKIVGRTDAEFDSRVRTNSRGAEYEEKNLLITSARVAQDTFEFVGEYRMRNNDLSSISHGDAYVFDLDGNAHLDTVYIPKTIDTSGLNWGDTVKFTAKVYGTDYWLIELKK